MIDEYFDILDENGEKTGESRSHTVVHKDGYIHRAVHVWLVNSQNQLLLQKRSKMMDAYPMYWDISASGHVSSGQTSIEAAQMETREELGLDVLENDFKFLFTLRVELVLNDGSRLENEFRDVYLVKTDLSISEFKLQKDEIEDVMWIDLDKFQEWIDGKGGLLVPHIEEYEPLLDYLKRKNG